MTRKILTTAAFAILMVTTSIASATEFTKGEVTKVDAKTKKVTIRHEELKSLDMPAMMMVFTPANDEIAAKLTEGAKIEFVAERVNGKLTVTEVKE
jgi:Cu/Ag efflux protein CusF